MLPPGPRARLVFHTALRHLDFFSRHGSGSYLSIPWVEEKFPQENFRVLSEMRFLGKIRVAILDLVGYVEILAKFGAKSDFRV